MALFEVQEEQTHGGKDYRYQRVMRVIERTIDKRGQLLLVPEIEIEGWWTSLDRPTGKNIRIYQAHGTSEQFLCEFKRDLARIDLIPETAARGLDTNSRIQNG